MIILVDEKSVNYIKTCFHIISWELPKWPWSLHWCVSAYWPCLWLTATTTAKNLTLWYVCKHRTAWKYKLTLNGETVHSFYPTNGTKSNCYYRHYFIHVSLFILIWYFELKLFGLFNVHVSTSSHYWYYSDHASHCVCPLSRLEPGLTVCQASMLTTNGHYIFSEN